MTKMKLEKKSYEELQKELYVANMEALAYKGCLESIERILIELQEFAETHDFVGDMFVCGSVVDIRQRIKCVLGKEEK